MDNAVGLRLLIDPSEAYDQISDCCRDVGDDSDDEDFEPSLNFTIKVCHVNFICFSCNLHT
jgi:hypothetical protein